MNTQRTSAVRMHIAKSRAGHYTLTLRDARGFVVYIQDKLTLEVARAAGRAAVDVPSEGRTLVLQPANRRGKATGSAA